MNYKKIIILPALFVLSNLLYIGCCKCVDSAKDYYYIESLSVSTRGSGFAIIDTGTVTNVDSVFLNYSLNGKCVASAKNLFAFLVNSSYACKCDECGRSGLKVKLVSIDITSDSLYNGVAANNSLKSLFKLKYYDNAFVAVDSAIRMNNELTYGLSLMTTTKPGNNLGHKFNLKMLFADGRELTTSTKTIYWQ